MPVYNLADLSGTVNFDVDVCDRMRLRLRSLEFSLLRHALGMVDLCVCECHGVSSKIVPFVKKYNHTVS